MRTTWIKTCYKTAVIGCSLHTLSLLLMKSLPIKPGHSWIYTSHLSATADIIHIPTLGTVYTCQPQISGQHPICIQYTISQKGQQLCSLVAISCNKNSFHSMIYSFYRGFFSACADLNAHLMPSMALNSSITSMGLHTTHLLHALNMLVESDNNIVNVTLYCI